MFPTLSMSYIFWLNLFSLCSLKNESGLSKHFKSIWFTFNQYPSEHLNVFMMSILTICSKSINQLDCFFFNRSFCKPCLIQDSSRDMWGSEPEHQNKVHLGSRRKIKARPYTFSRICFLFISFGIVIWVLTWLTVSNIVFVRKQIVILLNLHILHTLHCKCTFRVWKVDLRGYVYYSK